MEKAGYGIARRYFAIRHVRVRKGLLKGRRKLWKNFPTPFAAIRSIPESLSWQTLLIV
jgi:hypothetical protein